MNTKTEALKALDDLEALCGCAAFEPPYDIWDSDDLAAFDKALTSVDSVLRSLASEDTFGRELLDRFIVRDVAFRDELPAARNAPHGLGSKTRIELYKLVHFARQARVQIQERADALKALDSGQIRPLWTVRGVEDAPSEEGRKDDSGKEPWHLLPLDGVRAVLRVLAFGATKYSPNGWMKVPDARDRYYSAAMRHLTSWHDGEEYDPESGESHLAHAACCVLFLLWRGWPRR